MKLFLETLNAFQDKLFFAMQCNSVKFQLRKLNFGLKIVKV